VKLRAAVNYHVSPARQGLVLAGVAVGELALSEVVLGAGGSGR
jgi:hypothetical protein